MQMNAKNMSIGAQVTMSAVIGGTAEKIGGGKFANGAVTGAYVMMFNHLRHDGDKTTTINKAKEISQNDQSSGSEINNVAGVTGSFVSSASNLSSQVLETVLENLESIPKDFPIEKDIILISKVSKYSKIIKWAGWAGTATSVVAVEIDVGNGTMTRTQGWIEQGSNAIGAIPVVGTAWMAGWELGKLYGPSKWFKR